MIQHLQLEPVKPEGEAPKTAKPETSNGDALVQPELPEFGANNPEIKNLRQKSLKSKSKSKTAKKMKVLKITIKKD